MGIRVVTLATNTSVNLLPAGDSLEAIPVSWTPDGKLFYCRLTRHPTEMCDAVVSSVDASQELLLAPAIAGLVPPRLRF